MEAKPKNNRIEAVINLILKTFKFLERQYSYTPTYNVQNDNTFIESLDIEYSNESKYRKVIISYTKNKVYEEIKYSFNCSIIKIPYSRIEDFFSLSNYLQSTGRDFSTSLVNHFDETEAEKILTQIAIVLKAHTSDILDGRQWLETYYPRID